MREDIRLTHRCQARGMAATLANSEETVAVGASSLTYDADADRYTYVWKTERSWANTCRQLIVTLGDGTTQVANFRFSR